MVEPDLAFDDILPNDLPENVLLRDILILKCLKMPGLGFVFFTVFLKIAILLEIIIDSQEVAKIAQRVPVYPSFSFFQWLHLR